MKNLSFFKKTSCLFPFFPCFVAGMLFFDSLFAQDTVFISQIKNNFYKDMGIVLEGSFFETKSDIDSAFLYLYVSRSDKVESALPNQMAFNSFGNDMEKARLTEVGYQEKGYDTFIYKTHGTSTALLTTRFSNYPKLEQCFIIYHELMHNFIIQKKLNLDYASIEALCDVAGNTGAIDYARSQSKEMLDEAKQMVRRTEKIYRCINKAISKNKSSSIRKQRCESLTSTLIQRYLKGAGDFQKDRFDANVNNAYLLKNSFYSKNYFKMKRKYLEQLGKLNHRR